MSDWQRSQLQCRHEGRQNWLHAKKRTLSERQGPGQEKAIPTSAIESTEQTFSSECQTGNVPSCSVVTKAARTGCTPKKGHSLNDKAPVEKEGQNGGFSKALNWPFGCRTTEFLLLSSNACFGGHFPNTGERTASIRGRQPIKVEGRPGKVKPSISWVWGVRKRRPKCSLGHSQSELSLEIRLKRKPPTQENHWAKETGRLGDFSMWKHRKSAVTHTHKISELIW